MPMKTGTSIGIRPGKGKQANEFDELDAEDKRIAAEEEAKAQAGIPPGADHPRNVSKKNAAMRAGERKAKLDTMGAEQKAQFLQAEEAKAAKKKAKEEGKKDPDGGAAVAGASAGAASIGADDEDDNGEPKPPPPGGDIAVDPKDIEWFCKIYRVRPWLGDNPVDLHDLESLHPVADRPKIVTEFQVTYNARPELLTAPEVTRRAGVLKHIDSYHVAVAEMKTPPRSVYVTDLTPKLKRLSARETLQLEDAERLKKITSRNGDYSPQFRGFRDYLLWLFVFLAFIYCARDTGDFMVREAFRNEIGDKFETIVSAGELFTFLKTDLLDLAFPLEDAAGNALGCEAKQFLRDGVSRRVGNLRVRQLRSGLSPRDLEPGRWNVKNLKEYFTCQAPGIFKDALASLGGDRCFRAWGYSRRGAAGPVSQQRVNFRGVPWRNAVELDTPSFYSVETRSTFPGDGYAQLLANRKDLALQQLDAMESQTWVDVQTRIFVVEFTVLNPFTNLVGLVRLSIQFGAQGEVVSEAAFKVSHLYRYFRNVAQMRAALSGGGYAVGGVLAGALAAGLAFYFTRVAMRMLLPLAALFTAASGVCGFWWGLAVSVALGETVLAGPLIWPGLEAFVYLLVFYQCAMELVNMKRARQGGDNVLSYLLSDPFNLLHVVNLGFFLTAFYYRFYSISKFSEKVDDLEASIPLPCGAQAAVASSYASLLDSAAANSPTQEEEAYAAAWTQAPEGCWGTYVEGSTRLPFETEAEELAWGGSRYALGLGLGSSDSYVDIGECPWAGKSMLGTDCCAEVGFMNLLWVNGAEQWVDHLHAFNALFLTLRFFKFVRMFSSLSLFSETLREAMRRMLHIGLIILLIMTGFSVTFHLSFGFQDERYRDFPESIKNLFEGLLGGLDVGTLRAINIYLAPLFVYSYILVMVMVVLSMFVAIVNNCYEDTREKLAMPDFCFFRDEFWQYCVDRETLEPAYNQHEVLAELGMSKDFLRDISTFTLTSGDKHKLAATLGIVAAYSEGKWADEGCSYSASFLKNMEADLEALLGRDLDGDGDVGEVEPDEGRKGGKEGGKGHAGERPLEFVLRKPDGKSEAGEPTRFKVRNTVIFQAQLARALGTDYKKIVDDLVHVWWIVTDFPPLRWLLGQSRGPGRWLRWLLPTVPGLLAWFHGDSADEQAEQSDGMGDEGDEGDEGGDLDMGGGVEDDRVLRAAGLGEEEIKYIRKVEAPKLSLMKELTGLEAGQRKVLLAIDGLTKRCKEMAQVAKALERRKTDLAARERLKEAARQEAERAAAERRAMLEEKKDKQVKL